MLSVYAMLIIDFSFLEKILHFFDLIMYQRTFLSCILCNLQKQISIDKSYFFNWEYWRSLLTFRWWLGLLHTPWGFGFLLCSFFGFVRGSLYKTQQLNRVCYNIRLCENRELYKIYNIRLCDNRGLFKISCIRRENQVKTDRSIFKMFLLIPLLSQFNDLKHVI